MRFCITFERTGRQRMMPVDYQYYIGAWIYKVIGKADPAFARFLHEQGYADGNKHFKLFCYSPLHFGKPVLWKERGLFEIMTNTLSVKVSFFMPDAAERFIIGLFNDQQVFVGNMFNGIDLSVLQIERLSEPAIHKHMKYRANSPVVVSYKEESQRYARYLSPEDEGYSLLLKNNLIQKLKTIPIVPHLPDDFDFALRITGTARSKLVAVKPGTSAESKVRGFIYPFELSAPEALHHLLLAAGFGEKNASGFGWVETDNFK